MDAELSNLYYIALAIGALLMLGLASIASYLTELRDEIERNNTTIEQEFSVQRLGINFAIAFYFCVLGSVGAYIVVDWLTDFIFLKKLFIAISTGSFVGFINRMVIAFAKENLPSVVKSWLMRKHNGTE